MTSVTGSPQRADDASLDDRRQWQLLITVGLLVAFGGLVVWLITIADENPDVWQRRIYVFTGVQAVVFTAVGWLFGREVNLSAAKAANASAEQAKSDAESARSEAHLLREQLGGAALAVEHERSKGRAARAAVNGLIAAQANTSDDRRDAGLSTARPADLTAVKTVLDDIYQE